MSLKIKNLKKVYADIQIFNDFNLEIEEEKITCILGVSGIGKTLLLNTITGITPADSADISDFSCKTFSYIFQEPRLLRWKTVYGNILFALKDFYSGKEARNICNKYIDIVGLTKFKNYYPAAISGGMEQRVSIARAFAYPSNILLMDEPFKSLDFRLKKNIISTFINLWDSDRRTVIFITHDIEEAAFIGDKIFILSNRLPVHIKKELNIDIPQKERGRDNKYILKIKKSLTENL
ncbi:MAG: ABC transporter ATP-binding protein [Actinomycetota bacterium]|jgi:NitT/TauT family transport system ATP-binding protein|nr:ABC transporter ATP-binding protein [Actinomycetota bacterium]